MTFYYIGDNLDKKVLQKDEQAIAFAAKIGDKTPIWKIGGRYGKLFIKYNWDSRCWEIDQDTTFVKWIETKIQTIKDNQKESSFAEFVSDGKLLDAYSEVLEFYKSHFVNAKRC